MNRTRSIEVLLVTVPMVVYAVGSAFGLKETRTPDPGAPQSSLGESRAESAAAESTARSSVPVSLAIDHEIRLDHDVDDRVEIDVGAVVRWIADGDLSFPKESLVRPVFVTSIATWKQRPLSTAHKLYWLDVRSKDSLVGSISVFDARSSDADAPPPSHLSFEVRPKATWADVENESDVLVAASLRPGAPLALEHAR